MISARPGTQFMTMLPQAAKGPILHMAEWDEMLIVFTETETWCWTPDVWKMVKDEAEPMQAYCDYNARKS